MKNIFRIIFLVTLSITFTGCEDWLLEETPGVTKLEDYFVSDAGQASVKLVTAAYVPLTWQYNKTFYSEWFIGDVVSDDALKGGQSVTGDMGAVYDLENFKTITNNELLLDFYRAQYQGIGRCNLVFREVEKLEIDKTLDEKLKNRILGEASFLRAMYYFRLVRIFGGVPKVTEVIDSSDKWGIKRATTADIYNLILSDLEEANKYLWKKSDYDSKDMGRATKGAAQAMLLKTYLYTKQYDLAKQWGDSIIESGEYGLGNFFDNFKLSGENGLESVFEIQYAEESTSDYGSSIPEGGNGATRGNFTVILTRSRAAAAGGWGFNKPTKNLYNEFETGDTRRDSTIMTDTELDYLGNSYLNKKYAMMNPDKTYIKLAHDTRAPLNIKTIRYADVLLMYAEACCELNNLTPAKWALEEVRKRARAGNIAVLPEFPNYNSYTDTQDDLRKAIRHERRVELAMEGHRWFDLVRWGIAKETMDTYKATESEEVQSHMATFITGKNELFPIPVAEIELNSMEQNPGY